MCVFFRSDAGLPEVYRWSAAVLFELEELWRPGGRSGAHEVPQCHHHWSSRCGESSQQRQAESIRLEQIHRTHKCCHKKLLKKLRHKTFFFFLHKTAIFGLAKCCTILYNTNVFLPQLLQAWMFVVDKLSSFTLRHAEHTDIIYHFCNIHRH